MRSNYKQLGQYISEVNIKNTNLEVDLLFGVSITKKFIPSIANTIGTDMSKYKVVRKNQFGYGPITSRNGDKISVALLTEEQCIISTSYRVFEIKDHEELDPEYLMMWFRRPEFDRYARFMSHGSTREAFDWDEMCETELPVPSIEKQREIVKEYNTIVNRIKLNEQLNQKLEETAQALYKHWFVDFEFPNKNGQPYKSSGGAMVYNEELDQEIPLSFSVRTLGEITSRIDNRGKTPKHFKFETIFPLVEIGSIKGKTRLIDLTKCVKYLDEHTYKNDFRDGHPIKKDILFSTVGSLAELKIIANEKCSIAQNIVAFRCNENIGNFIYQQLKNSLQRILQYNIGSVQASIKVSQIVNLPILIPQKNELLNFEEIVEKITNQIELKTNKNIVLEKLREVLLFRMSKVESLQTIQVT